MPIKSESVDRDEVLTFDSQPLDGERVGVGGRFYTFRKLVKVEKDLLPDVEGEVAIGADLAESIANLRAAVLNEEGAGAKYARSTPAHPSLRRKKIATTLTTLTFGPEADLSDKDRKAQHDKLARDEVAPLEEQDRLAKARLEELVLKDKEARAQIKAEENKAVRDLAAEPESAAEKGGG